MNRHRIELLVTLALFAAVMITALPARAHVRVLSTSTTTVASVRPGGAIILSGDPDDGGNVAPPPTSGKNLQPSGGWNWAYAGVWWKWAGRIWVTLLLRYSH
jgi:hypothetical protein